MGVFQMTIDEAIAHAREKAEDNRKYAQECEECAKRKIDKMMGLDKIHQRDMQSCIKCAEEQEQLAKMLEELQSYKQGNCTNDCEHFDNCSNYIYSKGYNKAIDDLVFQSKKVRARGLITNWGKPFGIEFDKLDEIAQQLKEGAVDGNSTTDT